MLSVALALENIQLQCAIWLFLATRNLDGSKLLEVVR